MTLQTRTVMGIAILTLLALTALAAEPDQGPPFRLQEVAPGVYAAIDIEARSGANAGFVIGDDGVAVIDSFQYPKVATLLLAEIRKLTPLPIRYLINTHHHIDHVAGNGVFRSAGAVIVAQRNVAAWIRTENLQFFGPGKTEERAQVEALPLPDLLVDKELTIRLGNRRLELRAMPGHTAGDLVVAVPDAKVVFTGDVFWRRVAPSLLDASVPQWTGALENLQHHPGAAAYTYVPGQGDVAKLSDIADFARYLTDLTEGVRTALASGARGDALVTATLPALKTKYASWLFFDTFAPKEIALMAAELTGTKRLPPLPPAATW